MSIMDKVLSAIGLRLKQRATINTIMGNEISLIGIGPEKFVKDAYKANPNVFAVIGWITHRVSRTKWRLYSTANPEERVEIFDHPVLDLLERPNPAQSKSEFLEAACGYKKITGEVFIHGISPEGGMNRGRPKELWVLPTPLMSVRFDRSGIPVKYEVMVNGQRQPLEPEEVMYLRQFNPGEGNRGMSSIQAGAKVVTQSNDAYMANMKLLQNLGAQGILSMEDDNAQVTQEQIDQMETKINEKYSGPTNYGRVMVNSIRWKWQQIGLSATDLSLLESQKMSLRDICNLFNLNSQLFNDPDNTTYNNIQEARKAGITDAVIPEIEAFKDAFNHWLIPMFGENLKLDYDKMTFPELQKNMKELVEWLERAWWFTGNQKLEFMDRELSDNPIMDEILLPTSLVPVGEDNLEKAYSRTLDIPELKDLLKTNGSVA